MSSEPLHHLIVPFAQCVGADWLQAMSTIALKNLDKLLRSMQRIDTDAGQADSLSPPHERVLAKALHLADTSDGLIPWAALQAKAKPDQAWAFITPCHWAMGREHATLTDPAALELSEADARVLLAAMQPYFATDSITLHYLEPTRWLAEGEMFGKLPSASLDRVLGRNVDPWLAKSKQIKLLQNEMQMLLYTHPVNDARSTKGQRSVNSFWLSGTGALTEKSTFNPVTTAHITSPRTLAQAAFNSDWAAYAAAWAALDAGPVADLLARQRAGGSVQLSLCSESSAMTFESMPPSFLSKIKHIKAYLRPDPAYRMLSLL